VSLVASGGCRHLRLPDPRRRPIPPDAFLAGDSAEAKAAVATFLTSLDLRPLDAGGLQLAFAVEWAGILLMGLARNGAGFDLALGAEAR